jgi:hypothetical protein
VKGSDAVLKKLKSSFGNGKRPLLVIVLIIALVPAAKAGIADIVTIFQTINSTLRQVGGVLNTLQNLKLSVANLETRVVWPVRLINQARNFVFANEAQARSLLSGIQNLSVSSATLVNPSQLESIARSAQAAGIGQLKGAFARVYSSVPSSLAAPQLERNMMDMDDAAAQTSLKTALASDQISRQMLNVATGLENQTALAAPGSAPLLSTEARVAELENQAYLTRMLAAQLRQEAVQLAHGNSLRKKSVDSTRNLRMNLQQILAQPSGGAQ